VDQDNVNAIIAGVVPALVLTLLGFASRGAAGPGQLRYSRVWRGFSLFLAIVPPLGVLALAIFQKKPFEPSELATVIALAVFFPALSAPLLLEFLRVRHDYDDVRLAFRSPWTRHRDVRWADVASLRWRKMAKWLDLRTRDGVVVHISPMLVGLRPFADVALARIPPEVLEAHGEGRDVLLVMASGKGSDLLTSPLPPAQILITPRR